MRPPKPPAATTTWPYRKARRGDVLLDFEPLHVLTHDGGGQAWCSCGEWEICYDSVRYKETYRLREHLKEGFYKHLQWVRDHAR